MVKIFDNINIVLVLLFIVHLNNFVCSQCPSGLNYTNYGCPVIITKQIQGVMCKPIGFMDSYAFSFQRECPIITPTSPPIFEEIGRTNLITIENGNLQVTNCFSNFYSTNIYNFGKNCLNSSDSFINTVNYKFEKDLFIQSCSNNITYFIPTFNSSLMIFNEINGNGYCKQFGAKNTFYANFYYANLTCPNCNHGTCLNNKCSCDKAYQIDEFCRINFCDQTINPCVGNRTCDRINANCYCSPGFKLNDKGDCIDINECLNSSDDDFNNYICPLNFICNNKIGSYSCDCPFTLSNNNTTCTIKTTSTLPNLEPSKNSTTSFNLTNPKTELFENLKFKSLIIIKSLNELDFQDKIIKQYNLESILWSFNNQTNNDFKQQIETYYYNTTINSTSISKSLNKSTEIKVLFNWYKDIDSNVNVNVNKFKFANQEIKIEPYSLKFNIEISSYSFESDLNTLQLIIQSQVESQVENDHCSTNSINIVNNDNNNYFDNFKIKLNDRILNCNFIKRGIVDGAITTLSNSYSYTNSTNLSIAINIPHYENLIQMDPSFGILIDHTSSTNEQGCKSEESRKWIEITIGVVVGFVGATILIIAGFIIYKRNQTNIKVGLNKLKKLGNH
ncbi:hypothetical protein ACTFIZ_011202 [Dictyostelium cf. discoideum]